MSSYPFHGYAAPDYHPPQHIAQAYMVPARPVVMQPVQIHPVPPAPPILVRENWTVPGPLLPLPKHSSRRQRSEPEPSDAYDYPPHQSKLKDHSRAYDQHRARLEQPLHPKKAIEYQDQEQEADGRTYYSYDATAMSTDSETPSESLAKYKKEPSKSISSQQVYTKSHSSKLRYAPEYVEYQPDAADEQAKWSSANRARNERKYTTTKPTISQGVRATGDSSKLAYGRKHIESPPDAADKQGNQSSAKPAAAETKHKTKKSTSATHAKPDTKRRPERPGEQAKEGEPTNTAGTGRAHTTSHSSKYKTSIRLGESRSEAKITVDQHEGSSMEFKFDPKHRKIGISMPTRKSTGHHSKEKAKKSSRDSRSTLPTKEEVPDYYAIIGCAKNDTFETISSKIKKRQLELHPDKRVKGYMSEERIAEINRECALVNVAAEVLKDQQEREAYDRNWRLLYRVDKDGNTVSR